MLANLSVHTSSAVGGGRLAQRGAALAPALSTAIPHLRRLAAAAAASPAGSGDVSYAVVDSVAVLRLDVQGEKMNTLSAKLMADFEAVLTKLEGDTSVKAAVLISGKPDSFIAGADIKMLAACTTAEEAEGLAKGGQAIMDRIAGSKTPIVAAIHGACLGGGLEVALACHQRVATSHAKTQLAVPEVMLGLLPGSGGTQRLPRLVGMQAALDMMLTGKNIRPDKAKKMGLVDVVVDPNALERTAVAVAKALAAGTAKPSVSRKKKSWLEWALEDTPPGRNLMFSKANEAVAKKTGGKYPAPPAILRVARAGLEGGHKTGSAAEASEFGKLAVTPECAALQGLFFGQTACKKNAYGNPAAPVSAVGVLGAGLMGAGIAQVSAVKGFDVMLKDMTAAGLARGEAQIASNLAKKVKKKQLSPFIRDTQLAKVTGITPADAHADTLLQRCDLVVEAVFEELSVKHKVVAEMEGLLSKDAIIASNTSTLPLGSIAQHAKHPERIVGMHYFSPVDQMPLLEVIPHAGTSDDTCARAVDVGIKQGKTVIVVKDVPGFYVNRCLGPMISECMSLVQAGTDALALNATMKKFGFPVGPITLADEVGIDVTTHVVHNLTEDLGVRMEGADLSFLDALVAEKILGKKTSAGFFTYSKGKGGKVSGGKALNPRVLELLKPYQAKVAQRTPPEEEIQHRMAGRFVNEAALCLQDGVISSPSDGDIGAVFGIGFPPFLGGPFRYVDSVGAQTFVDRMDKLADAHGEQFRPCQILRDNAKAGTSFHANA